MGSPAIKIKKSTDEKFYFILVAGNGQTVATSETYESKQACKDGIECATRIICDSIGITDETN